ncbi:MAG: hypothetical protein ACYDA6_09300 [Solirubrobacteraceae bacterium]
MDSGPGPLRRADWLIGGGALVLLVSMLVLPWYGESTSAPGLQETGGGFAISATGWEAFTSQRWIWALTIVASLAVFLLVASGRRAELPDSSSVLITAFALLTSIFILYRIVHHPSAGSGGAGLKTVTEIKLGTWLGLVGALGATAGGLMWMREEGLSRPGDGGAHGADGGEGRV